MKYVVISIIAVALLVPATAEATLMSGWKHYSSSFSSDKKVWTFGSMMKKINGLSNKRSIRPRRSLRALVFIIKPILLKKLEPKVWHMNKKQVPEPGTLGLIALGLVGLGLSRRRINRR